MIGVNPDAFKFQKLLEKEIFQHPYRDFQHLPYIARVTTYIHT